MAPVVRLKDFRRNPPYLHFTRSELNRLLGLYSTRVIRGEWRDYAIHHGPDAASFMIFNSSQEFPTYVISKLEPKGGKAKDSRRYVVMSRQHKLKQGTSLDDVLSVFDRPIKLVSG